MVRICLILTLTSVLFGQEIIHQENFNAGPGSFNYSDDLFRSTSGSNIYATGEHRPTGGFEGGALFVVLGGVDNKTILNMSGGWTLNFNLAAARDINLTFRYNLTQFPDYENNEISQALVSLDGKLLSETTNDFLAEFTGDGNFGPSMTTGWVQVNITVPEVGPGNHTLSIGGFNNQKTFANESTEIGLDDLVITGAPVSDTIVHVQENFDVNAGGFTYADDEFNTSGSGIFAEGVHRLNGGFQGGGLFVTLGGQNNDIVTNMSGGWKIQFTLTEPRDLSFSFRYKLSQQPDYESDEFTEALASLNTGNVFLLNTLMGDGNGGPVMSTGWVLKEINIGLFSAGTHTIVLGGFNNKKTFLNESSEIGFDDFKVFSTPFLQNLVLDENFDLDEGGFNYSDDVFRATTRPNYADGQHSTTGGFAGGKLSVSLGGIDDVDITNGMSGGWSVNFNLVESGPVALTFRYRLTQSPNYESDEFSQVLAAIDGKLLQPVSGQDYIDQVTGNGNGGPNITTNWVETTIQSEGNLNPAIHTLTLGGFNNKKTLANEFTTVDFDDVRIELPTCSPYPLVLEADPDASLAANQALQNLAPAATLNWNDNRGTLSSILNLNIDFPECTDGENVAPLLLELVESQPEIFQIDLNEWENPLPFPCSQITESNQLLRFFRSKIGPHVLSTDFINFSLRRVNGVVRLTSVFGILIPQGKPELTGRMSSCAEIDESGATQTALGTVFGFTVFNQCTIIEFGNYTPNSQDIVELDPSSQWNWEETGSAGTVVLNKFIHGRLIIHPDNVTEQLLGSDTNCPNPNGPGRIFGYRIIFDAVTGEILSSQPGIGCIVC